MTPIEALSLLVQWAGQEVCDAYPADVSQILRRLGYLPLAIKLAGSQLRNTPPPYWLGRFDIQKLESSHIEETHNSLRATFALSLTNLLPTSHKLYIALAIFKEDEGIPFSVIAKLWSQLGNLDETETDKLLHVLAERALLQFNLTSAEKIDDSPNFRLIGITLHDLLRDFIEDELGETGRIEAHQALLTAYRKTQVGNGWHSAPDDGYLYNHLVYHLNQVAPHDATAVVEIKKLFASDEWLHVRFTRSNNTYEGYISDLMLAWQSARLEALQQIKTRIEPEALADCVRYALIRTSINSLAASYEPALIIQAVACGLWQPEQALSVASKVPDPHDKAAIIHLIIVKCKLTNEQKRQAEMIGADAAKAIHQEWLKQPNFTKTNSPEAKQQLQEELEILSHYLSVAQQVEALRAGLKAITSLYEPYAQAETVVTFAPYLHIDTVLRSDALIIAIAIEGEQHRMHALAALLPWLQDEQKKQAINVGFEALKQLRYWHWWRRAVDLPTFILHLSSDMLDVGLDLIEEVDSDRLKAELLINFAPHSSENNLHKALTIANTIEKYDKRIAVQFAFVIYLDILPRQEYHKLLAETVDSWPYDWQLVLAIALLIDRDKLREVVMKMSETPFFESTYEICKQLMPHLLSDDAKQLTLEFVLTDKRTSL